MIGDMDPEDVVGGTRAPASWTPSLTLEVGSHTMLNGRELSAPVAEGGAMEPLGIFVFSTTTLSCAVSDAGVSTLPKTNVCHRCSPSSRFLTLTSSPRMHPPCGQFSSPPFSLLRDTEGKEEETQKEEPMRVWSSRVACRDQGTLSLFVALNGCRV